MVNLGRQPRSAGLAAEAQSWNSAAFIPELN